MELAMVGSVLAVMLLHDGMRAVRLSVACCSRAVRASPTWLAWVREGVVEACSCLICSAFTSARLTIAPSSASVAACAAFAVRVSRCWPRPVMPDTALVSS
ncbi:hypothetical protein V8C86DRAFT_2507190 [Haematococcus lacustris]